MQTITITATQDASRRTKNRIREHGPVFTRAQSFISGQHVDQRPMNHPCLDGKLAVNVNSPDAWGGWLPVKEIEIIENNELTTAKKVC